MAHQHRSGGLKQKNKRHKSTASSKRSLNRKTGAGRVNGGGTAAHRLGIKGSGATKHSRLDRQHMSQQRRDKARDQKMLEARGIKSVVMGVVGGNNSAASAAPSVIGIIALSGESIAEAKMLEESVRQHIAQEATTTVNDGATTTSSPKEGLSKDQITSSITCHFATQKKTLTLLTNSTAFYTTDDKTEGNTLSNDLDDETVGLETDDLEMDTLDDKAIHAALDLVRVCDAVLFVVNGTTALHPLWWNDELGVEDTAHVNDGGSVAGMTFSTMQTKRFEKALSERGERMLTALKAHGVPTPLTALCYDENNALLNMSQNRKKASRRRAEVRKYAQRLAVTEFGTDSKVLEVDLDVSNVMETFHPIPGQNNTNSSSTIMSTVQVTMDAVDVPDMVMDTDMNDVASLTGNSSVTGSVFTTHSTSTKHSTKSGGGSSHQSSVLVRTLCGSAMVPVKWANMRSHLVTNGNEADASTSGSGGYSYNASTNELSLTGYLRGGPPLNVNSLMHVPHLGTYAISRVEHSDCPIKGAGRHPNKKHNNKDADMGDTSGDVKVLVTADPSQRESLGRYAAPDALEGEQNLVGFDDAHDDENEDGDMQDLEDDDEDEAPGKARPTGWSDYQTAWLDALDPQDANFSDDGGSDGIDHGELAKALNAKKGGSDDDMMDDDDLSVSSEERAALAEQRRKTATADLTFPDEIELKTDELARDRLARYRSIKSFRESHWDPKESLPESYSDIYHFTSFKATQRDILADTKHVCDTANEARVFKGWQAGQLLSLPSTKEEKNDASMDDLSEEDEEDEDAELLEGCVASGSYVKIVLEGISAASYAKLLPSKDTLLSCVALLPHENKVSALHMAISQTSTCEPGTVPVKSKDTLTFRCGWRTWQGCPIFSQNNLNSDKHKYERYLVPNSFVAASVLGPVTYTPCPVLVYREPTKDNARRQLVAFGSLLSADADRIVIKRIVLTGYPTRVHKRHATVKYMFYNPEDVKWFQPAGLSTKHGLQGHIMESNGEHGTMKCLFNAPIKQHDTVCLPLYKRVYPKYAKVVGASASRGLDNNGDGGSRNDKLVIL
jgi:pre-rRNA-processing protein TSR1